MMTGIIPVLSQRNPATPLFGAGVNKASEISFHALIQPFRLSISGRMIRCAQFKLRTNGMKQILPELASEHWIPVGGDCFR